MIRSMMESCIFSASCLYSVLCWVVTGTVVNSQGLWFYREFAVCEGLQRPCGVALMVGGLAGYENKVLDLLRWSL